MGEKDFSVDCQGIEGSHCKETLNGTNAHGPGVVIELPATGPCAGLTSKGFKSRVTPSPRIAPLGSQPFR